MAERLVTLAGEADVAGFRDQARRLLVLGVAPARVDWQVATRAEGDLFGDASDEPAAPGAAASVRVNVPAFFVAARGHHGCGGRNIRSRGLERGPPPHVQLAR